MQATKTRGICREENRETRWSFSGWATPDGSENAVRPRGYYRSCQSCGARVLTLADVDDALALCRAVMANWVRKVGSEAATKVDVDNVTGDLYVHVWHLYSTWVASFGAGNGTFTGYATHILSRKIHRFVAIDIGDPTEEGRGPKAHSRTLADSYDGIAELAYSKHSGRAATRGGLDFALGAVALDPTADNATSGGWVDDSGDSSRTGFDYYGGVEAAALFAPRNQGGT